MGSPIFVPPPFREKALRPSSAERALSERASSPTSSETAAGSRTAVYTPGSRGRGSRDRIAFSTARALTSSCATPLQSRAPIPAQPEPLPSAARAVIEYSNCVPGW